MPWPVSLLMQLWLLRDLDVQSGSAPVQWTAAARTQRFSERQTNSKTIKHRTNTQHNLSLSLFLYISTSLCLSLSLNIYIYTHVYIYIYIYIYIHVCVYIYIYVYIHIHVCIYIYIYIHICTYIISFSERRVGVRPQPPARGGDQWARRSRYLEKGMLYIYIQSYIYIYIYICM